MYTGTCAHSHSDLLARPVPAPTNGTHHTRASVKRTTTWLSAFAYYDLSLPHSVQPSRKNLTNPRSAWPQPLWILWSATLPQVRDEACTSL